MNPFVVAFLAGALAFGTHKAVVKVKKFDHKVGHAVAKVFHHDKKSTKH